MTSTDVIPSTDRRCSWAAGPVAEPRRGPRYLFANSSARRVLVHRAGAVRGAFRADAHEPGWPPIRQAVTAPGRR